MSIEKLRKIKYELENEKYCKVTLPSDNKFIEVRRPNAYNGRYDSFTKGEIKKYFFYPGETSYLERKLKKYMNILDRRNIKYDSIQVQIRISTIFIKEEDLNNFLEHCIPFSKDAILEDIAAIRYKFNYIKEGKVYENPKGYFDEEFYDEEDTVGHYVKYHKYRWDLADLGYITNYSFDDIIKITYPYSGMACIEQKSQKNTILIDFSKQKKKIRK